MTRSQVELDFTSLLDLWSQGLTSSSERSDDFLASWARNAQLAEEFRLQQSPGLRFSARRLSRIERAELFRRIEIAVEGELSKSGRHRQPIWEAGWTENLVALMGEEKKLALIPGYFENSKYVRLGEDFFEVTLPHTEAMLLGCLVDFVLLGLLAEFPYGNIHEFGCGTGMHVSRIAMRYPSRYIYGYDWAQSSIKILDHLRENQGQQNVAGAQFNFFEPDEGIEISKEDLVMTVAALEQVGSEFLPFLALLERKSPQLIVNIEPITELLDLGSPGGSLSAKYFQKRNYLKGFFSHIRKLEELGQAEILHAGRSGLGSLYIEGYSVVVWRFSSSEKKRNPRNSRIVG